MADASAVVASGSLPVGAPPDAYARLARAASSYGVPVVVDTSGPALRHALGASPSLVKPNLDELSELLDEADPLSAALQLSRTGGSAVVVSLGPAGMVLAADGEAWHGSLPDALHGNPTGAGDAAVAAYVRGLRCGWSWPTMLADAVALSAAAVLAPYAGEFSASDHSELARLVVVEQREAST